jgi:hypothetical protein
MAVRIGVERVYGLAWNPHLEAILEGILLRGGSDERSADQLAFWEREVIEPQRGAFFAEWEKAAEREKASRSLFAQHAFPLDRVVAARDAARGAVGEGIDVRRFTLDALRAHGATATERSDGAVDVEAREVPRAVRDIAAIDDRMRLRFAPPAGEDRLIGRTHPIVDGLATHVIDTALDPLSLSVARRAGVIRTNGVTTRTTALLVRLRYDLRTLTRLGERTALAEEVRVLAFTGATDAATWIAGTDEADRLLDLLPAGNVLPEQATAALERIAVGLDELRPAIERVAAARAADLMTEHERVREVISLRGKTTVTPQLPVDILGIYVFLPAPAA